GPGTRPRAPAARPTAPDLPTFDTSHADEHFISKSRYLISTYEGTHSLRPRFLERDETVTPVPHPPQALDRAGARIRRGGAPFAGQHFPLRARNHRVRRAGGAVPQRRAAGVRGAAAYPGRELEHHLRGGQAVPPGPGAAPAQRHRPPGDAAGPDRRGPTADRAYLSAARGRDATSRGSAAGPRAGAGRPPAPYPGEGRRESARLTPGASPRLMG